MPLDALALAEHAPGGARGVERAVVDEQERALESKPLVAPHAVGEGDEARLVLRRASLPEQQRLARRVRLAGPAVSQEVLGKLLPQRLVERGELGVVVR